jgi:hypothetical protein
MEIQNQKTEENSIAIQAGGSVNIGLNYTEVKTICFDLFKQNFPELVKQAAEEAKQNVENYVNKLEEALKQQLPVGKLQDFSRPEIQYILNETIKSSARYGNKSNQEVLIDLLVNRLANNDQRDIDLIIDKAIEIVPSLTSEQIKILSLQFYINTITKTDARSIYDIEKLSSIILSICDINDVEKVKQRQLLMFSALGLCSINTIITVNAFDVMMSRYPFLKEEITKDNIQVKMPATNRMIDIYSKLNLGMYTFNSVANAIAIITIKKIIRDIQLDMLLK